jgi:alanyl-tRNA synthetase
VDNAGKIGLFRIISETGVAAGVRRIEAVTGKNVMNLLKHYKQLAVDTATVIKAANIEDLAVKAAQVMNQLKETERKAEALEDKLAAGKLGNLMANAVEVGSVKVICERMNGTPDELRKMTDTVKADNKDAVAVFAAVNGEKVTFCAGCGADAVKNGAHAGNLVREVAKIAGGNGGGKPDSAMAGGKDASKVDEALNAVVELVKSQLK